ncbi:hypothetical protein F2Q68_00020397 [Brassica cretica]|uniref:Uncharacterized protein n=1 Tax=Brassica cretica TaxID=69181 RepID=A0A8S9G0S7_BRACR|nr:hypothetical protein F2Q68_00020397 [Brassica cretica]
MNREITETIDEENMLNQYVNKIGFRNLLKALRLLCSTVLRENHQIALFSASFVPAGPSPIQCNSRPVMTRKGLGKLDKDLKTN